MNNPHIRAQIRLDTTAEVTNFIRQINSDGTTHKYIIEDFEGEHRVDARSYLGVLYASAEFQGKMFLVNETEDGKFPWFIDEYRPLKID